MMYLVVIFLPPLYFLIRKSWGAFVLSAILYGLAWATLPLLFFLLPFSLVFWFLSVGHAFWHLRKEFAGEQADMIATRMAEELKKES